MRQRRSRHASRTPPARLREPAQILRQMAEALRGGTRPCLLVENENLDNAEDRDPALEELRVADVALFPLAHRQPKRLECSSDDMVDATLAH